MKHLPPLHRTTMLVGVVTSALIGTSLIASPAHAASLAGGKCVKVHVAGIPPVIGTWWPTFPRC